MTEELKTMKSNLMSKVSSCMANMDNVDTHELGEAIDMIKDLAEAEYYCSIVEAMDKSTKDTEERERIEEAINRAGYSEGRMGYSARMYQSPSHYISPYTERSGNTDWRDEGRNGYHTYYRGDIRRGYSDAKESHSLDSYMQDLSSDISEMINNASPEDKKLLKDKLTILINKI